MTALPFRLQRIFARRPARLRLASAWRALALIVVLQLTLALLALAPLRAAPAGEPIKGEVKAVNDGGFLRLMFQFDEAVEATTRVSGAIVIISFNKPVVLAVERLNVNAPEYISAARRDPTASITACTSVIRCSRGGKSLRGTRSDRPVPRLSKSISRENEASRLRNLTKDGSCQKYSRCDTQPITKTRSSGPLPTTW